LQKKKSELERLNLKVALITFEGTESAKQYQAETFANFPLLIDEACRLYEAYGMEEAGFWDIWGPATWFAYLREFLKGQLPGKPGGDISQRGGDVLIDPGGIVRLHHIGKGPADRPSIDSILNVISEKNKGLPAL
jgi:hypothetical protein